MTQKAREHLISRALAYPYEIPNRSYMYQDQQIRQLPSRIDVAGRTAVVCVGSNQSPEQLSRKFPLSDGWRRPIPMIRAQLAEHDAVYAGHFARYGALPATLMRCAEAVLVTFVAWLDQAQLTKMHATEDLGQNYDFVEITCGDLTVETGPMPEKLFCYVSRKGVFAPKKTPIALSALQAENRQFPEMAEPEALRWALDIAEAGPTEEAVPKLASDADFRAECNERLRSVTRRDVV